MKIQPVSKKAQQIESLLESDMPNPLQAFVQQEKVSVLESKGIQPSGYKLVALRENEAAGPEIFSLKHVEIGNYTEETMWGAAVSPLPRFRSTVTALAEKAASASEFDETGVEYGYQMTALWAAIGKLKDFLGLNPRVSQLVALLLAAKVQFQKKDTPLAAARALANSLRLISAAARYDSSAVIASAKALRAGGIDCLPFNGPMESNASGIS